MNIFVLSRDPVKAAQYQCDKHLVKMILETAQILCTVNFTYGTLSPYKPTHPNHPCVLWAGKSYENYMWLWAHLKALLLEYTARYGKVHKTDTIKKYILQAAPGRDQFPQTGLTPFVQVMPEECRVPRRPVAAYRKYYLTEKRHIAKWKNGAPKWWTKVVLK